MFSKGRALQRFSLFLASIVIFPPLYAILLWISPLKAQEFGRFYYWIVARMIGLLIKTQGTLTITSSTLFVSNHISYTDILVLGCLLPAAFVAKEEVRKWPFLGRLHGTKKHFLSRERAAQPQGMCLLFRMLCCKEKTLFCFQKEQPVMAVAFYLFEAHF